MNHKIILLCPLLLGLALSGCAPALQAQGPTGARTVHYRSGPSALFVQRVPVAELTDATPADAYVSFPGCSAVVQVADVRALGIEGGRAACFATGPLLREQAGTLQIASAVAVLPIIYFFYRILVGVANQSN